VRRGVVNSITNELERAAGRLARLQRVAGELNRATTVADVVGVVMRDVDASAPATARGLWLHEPGDDALVLTGASEPASRASRQFPSIPLDADLPGALAFRERRTVIHGSQAEAERHYEALRGIERMSQGFVAVPLLLEDACLGVLGLGYDEVPGPTDIEFVETIAGLVALTLARVRLADRDRRRREELEFLATLTDAALDAADHGELMKNVTVAAVPVLGDWCFLYFLAEGTAEPDLAVGHRDPVKVAWAQALHAKHAYDPDDVHGVAAVIRTGRTEFIPRVTPELIDEATSQPGRDLEDLRPELHALGLSSVITVPLVTKRRTVGAVRFIAEAGRTYDPDDVALAEAVAGRLAEALDSTWLADQHRHIAVTLQRALLPPRLPRVPGIDLAARYWPAAGAEVGGDFYDLFTLDPQRWAIVIGDVCGSGANAAAVTAIARHTIRAAARHGVPATELMDWLNQAVLLSDRDLFCTSVYATLARQGCGWELTTVAAGHPLPILLRPGDAPVTLGRPGTLLGAFAQVRTRAATTLLAPGDLVILYTDGVTDLPPPHGLNTEELLGLVDTLRDRPTAAAVVEGIHEHISQRAPLPADQDDVAIVALRCGTPT
jgi:serine phosphatase RsbU (regulator of sigma subunit)